MKQRDIKDQEDGSQEAERERHNSTRLKPISHDPPPPEERKEHRKRKTGRREMSSSAKRRKEKQSRGSGLFCSLSFSPFPSFPFCPFHSCSLFFEPLIATLPSCLELRVLILLSLAHSLFVLGLFRSICLRFSLSPLSHPHLLGFLSDSRCSTHPRKILHSYRHPGPQHWPALSLAICFSVVLLSLLLGSLYKPWKDFALHRQPSCTHPDPPH